MPDTRPSPESSIKETLISLIISFVMALVFRSYVVEAFIIPTGSMAPTLLGAHIRFDGPETGNSWAVNPWYMAGEEPYAVQGPGNWGAPSATDPMTTSRVNDITSGPARTGAGYIAPAQARPLKAGDRILVQKYLYNIFPPKRYDVVVFKNPELATQNFIKRLIGLPGEQVWIADGDIFTRPFTNGATPGEWTIQRKPARIQESVWRPLFSSEYTPLNPVRDGRRWFTGPWKGDSWQTEDRAAYRCESPEPTTLSWDAAAWPLHDWVPYNEFPDKLRMMRAFPAFPVGDLRMQASITPDQAGASVTASITAQRHEFQALIADSKATLRMRPLAPDRAPPASWTELASTPAAPFPPGKATSIEFWHADQALELRINDARVLRAEINWGPSERLRHATGLPGDVYAERSLPLNDASIYEGSKAGVSWSFSGSPLTLHRVGLDRDIYHEAARYHAGPRAGSPALATHPVNPATLGPDQFFVLGDNSPSSKDGRLWEGVDPWVEAEIDGAVGIVPRKLLLGKAFFVYFPSPYSAFGKIPIPDVGRMRFIR